MKTNIVYIGLGSNIKQPDRQIKNAIIALDNLPDTTVIRDSGFYKSTPMGPKDQPDYLNAVVEIETAIGAAELLKHCQMIEQQQGRVRLQRWGERTIDLDILLFADEQIETDTLTVPHPGICQRDFVYMPLLKLDPGINIPGNGLLKDVVGKDDKLEEKKYETDYGCQFAGNIGR